MPDDRKAVEGAIDFAAANATQEPVTRAGAAGYIQGVATDYYAGRLQRTGSRLGARGWLIEKILDGGPPTTNMAAWFKYGSGITVTGLGVSQWSDQSGNGRHLLQGTDTNRPALQADNSILFDGSDNFLKTAPFTLNQPETVYLLFRQVTWADFRLIFDGDTAAVAALRQRGVTPTIDLFSGGAAAGNTGLILNTYSVVASVINGASSLISVNNGTPTTGNPGAGSPGGFTLGGNGTGTANSNIQVKEAIVYSVAHDATTRAQVIRYLASVGGLSI